MTVTVPPAAGWSRLCERIAFAATRDRYLPSGGDRDDLLQEARIGVLEAIDGWNPSRGPFVPFASGCARRRVMDALTAAGRVKRAVMNDVVSIHRPAGDSDEMPLSDTLPAPTGDPVAALETRERLREAAAAIRQRLSDREYACLLGWIETESYPAICARLELTSKQVDQALQRARWKLQGAGPPSAPTRAAGRRAGVHGYRCSSCGGPTVKATVGRGRPPLCVVCRIGHATPRAA